MRGKHQLWGRVLRRSLLRCLFRAVCRHPGAFSLTPVHAWTRFVRIGQTRLGSGQAFAQDQSHTSQLALALEETHAHLCLAKITIGKFRRDPKRGPSWFTKVLGALTPAWCRIVDRIKILSLTNPFVFPFATANRIGCLLVVAIAQNEGQYRLHFGSLLIRYVILPKCSKIFSGHQPL